MSMTSKTIDRAMTAGALLWAFLGSAAELSSQTYFYKSVGGAGEAELSTFSIPAGPGAGVSTIFRIVTDAPLGAFYLELVPQVAGQGGNRLPVFLCPPGASISAQFCPVPGAHVTLEEQNVGTIVASDI